MKKLIAILCLYSLSIKCILSQAYPNTSLWMVDFFNIHGAATINKIAYLSNFNPDGYNNQPRFMGHNLIYATILESHEQHTDIIALDLNKLNTQYITSTYGISEFSPKPHPDGQHFTTVRIEADGVTQTLWMYPLNRANKGSRLLPKINNIGYYEWIDHETVVLFLVDKPHKLVIANTKTQTVKDIASDIGRCIKADTGEGTFYFTQINAKKNHVIKRYHIHDGSLEQIIELPAESEDFDVFVNGNIISNDGANLVLANPTKSKSWKTIASFDGLNISKISRMVVQRDRVVFVATKQ